MSRMDYNRKFELMREVCIGKRSSESEPELYCHSGTDEYVPILKIW